MSAKKDRKKDRKKDERKDRKEERLTQNLPRTIKAAKYMLGLVWRDENGKVYLFLKGITALIDAISPLPFMIFPGLIINELINNRQIPVLGLYAGILTIAPVIFQLLRTIMDRQIEKLSMSINLNLYESFWRHYVSMDFESVENPEIDLMKNRTRATLMRTQNIVNHVSSLVTATVSLIVISSIISTLNPLLVIMIVAFTYINSLITKAVNKKMYIIGKEISQAEHYSDSANFMLYRGSMYAKETRLFQLKSFLINHYDKFTKEYNALLLKNHTVGLIPGLFASALDFVQQALIYAYLFVQVLKHGLPIGNMTIYLTAVGQLSGAIKGIFGSYLNLSNASLRIQEAMEFMNMPLIQQSTGSLPPVFDEHSVIEFKNVSFKYAGSDTYAIKNLSIKIQGNEKLCIVGTNGAGKSTFIKLLAGLYRPAEGEILLNGININEYCLEEYQRLFSPVFQHYCTYFMPLRENIILGHEYDAKRLDDICRANGLTNLVNKLPKGYDTQIGYWIDDDGILPSGGEFEKIVIARAIYHDAPVFLLDEPTSALDPLIEYEIYKQFSQIMADKTSVLITHRLSAVQLADKIAVFDDGQLIEYGTHRQLYADGGKYTEMFDKQSQFFRDENTSYIKNDYIPS